MTPEVLRRRRTVAGVLLLFFCVWLGAGLRRTEEDGRVAVLDSRLGLIAPRIVSEGWHLAPPGLFRISLYPVRSATLELSLGGPRRPLATREGTAIETSVTLRYRVDAERVLEVHRTLGPRLESDAIARWLLDATRGALAAASYADISGTHTEELQATLSRTMGDRFREAGLVLLSCEVPGVRIRADKQPLPTTARGGAQGKVLLIGLDGADWNIVDPLMSAGRMPRLARLVHEGVRARLRSINPMLSPVIWTSIATGVVPARHGILDFVANTEREGERVPVSATQRRVKAIWNMLGERGVRVGVVGWWATYPAEQVNGFVVSDRVAYQLFGARAVDGGAREGKVFPPEADALVTSLTVAPENILMEDLAPFMRLPPDPGSLPEDQSRLVEEFKTLLASGRTYERVAVALEARYHTDFTAIYFEGTDTAAHLFMPYAPPPLQGTDAEARQRFGKVVDECYVQADAALGRLLDSIHPTTVMVLSDHGFRTGENRPLTESRIGYGAAADWHRKYGILVLHGPEFRRGVELDEASVLDITPTLLRLYGLPVGEDMDGRPIVEAFAPEFLKEHPEAYIPSWESPAHPAPSGSPAQVAATPEGETPGAPQGGSPATENTVPVAPSGASPDATGDAERIEKLRSLGYLAGETANTHNNRGTILLGQARYDEALKEFEKAIAGAEDLTIARLNMARAYYKKKDYTAATHALEEHMKRQPRSKEAENLLGNMALDQGDMTGAETHFRRALEYEPNFADARNSLGILYDRQGRTDAALEQFRKVVAIDPDYAEAYNNIGVILKNRKQIDQAIEAFRHAIAADASFAGSYSNLALVYEDRGDMKAAEEQFRNALHRDPDNAAVRTNFGGLLYLSGRLEEARQELERATVIDPSYASAYNNLGAVFGRLGRPEDEIAAYRKAAALDTEYADVHHNLGLALLKRGNAKEGESEMRRALQINPLYVPAYLNLGRWLLDQSRESEALELMRTATQRLPSEAGLQELLGEAELKLGMTDEAIRAFRESLRLKPDQPELRQRLNSLGVEKTLPADGQEQAPGPGGVR
jgi:Tfp pilus assembly protein PilF/arylsulfatase A-like enzyme